jgi:voltage-gated potassium channel
LPEDCVGLTVDDLSARLRSNHRATLLAVNRAGAAHTNPEAGFVLERGDDLVVVAEALGELVPLQDASVLT